MTTTQATIATPDNIRAAAVPLVLPPDGQATYRSDGPLWTFTCTLDPHHNRGYTRAIIGPHDQVRVADGDTHGGTLHPCHACRSPWAVTDTTWAWGNVTDCLDCGHHDFFSLGD